MPTHVPSSRAVRLTAWGLCALFVVLAGATVALVLAARGEIFFFIADDQGFVVVVLGFAVVGALVATREPGNAVGWLMLASALSMAFTSFADAYVADMSRPLIVPIAWVSSWIWYVWLYASALILPLIFPDGRVLSGRWRIVLWVGIGALVTSIVSAAFGPAELDVESPVPIPNPLAVSEQIEPILTTLGQVGGVLSAVGFLLSAVSVVLRLKRSHGRRRLQVKWFAYVGAMALTGMVLAVADTLVVAYVGEEGTPAWVHVLGATGWIGGLLLLLIGIPVAVGVAMLRHQLYEIDVVIKRTLVYGTLTVLLAGTYLVLVLSFRFFLEPLTGGSDLAVAASTLAVAALFRPARARVQAVVDRRFFRSRYDAALTVESFSGRLRQEVDLDAVSTDLGVVVRETMQPAHVSLWLRGSR